MKKYGYLVIVGLLFSQPLLVSATEVSESNNQANVEITEPQGENSLVSTSESEETEQIDTTENEIQVTKKENTTKETNEQEVKAGSEQTDQYDWDQETGTLTVKKGEFERDYINAADVNKIIFRKGVTFPDDSSNLFSNYVFLQAIEGLENIDSSNVINMQNMFFNLPNLKNLDVSCLNTSNVTNMSRMFSKSRNLINLNVSGFDTTNVTDMSYMFSELENLSSLDVSSFDTANVVYMNGMFAYMNHLTNLDINNFVTTKVIDMHDMFYDMPLLKSLDVSALNTSRVTDMHDMFSYLGATKLNLANFNTSNVTNMRRMFAYSDLTALDLSNFNTSNVTDMSHMFLASDFLSTIVLGEMTKLNSSIYLEPLKEGPEYTGNWAYIKDMEGNKPSDPLSLSDDELMNYDGSYPGTYVWEKKQGQPVTIQYVDEDGKNLAETTELTGLFGEPYEAQAKEIEGYLLDEEQLPENRTGTFSDQKQMVTFIYKKAPVKAGDVTVRYEDEEGNELLEAIVMSGNIGDSYSSEQKDFSGYTLKEVKGAVSGTFGIDPRQVVYVYQKEASSTDQSGTSNDKKPTDSTTPSEKGEGSNGQKSKESGSVQLTHSKNELYTKNNAKEVKKDKKLPQTNEQANPFLTVLGVGLVILLLPVGLWHKKRFPFIR